jgi:hypothetical protein
MDAPFHDASRVLRHAAAKGTLHLHINGPLGSREPGGPIAARFVSEQHAVQFAVDRSVILLSPLRRTYSADAVRLLPQALDLRDLTRSLRQAN